MEQEQQPNFNGFLKWAASHGISDSPDVDVDVVVDPFRGLGHSLVVSLFPLAGGRGLGAVRDLRKGELILRVPKSFLITRQILLEADFKLAAAVGSYRRPLSCNQVDDAIWAVEKAISRAKSEWKEAYRLMEQLELKPRILTFRAWLWAYGTISSRALHFPWDEAGCLCPVGDLFNYAAPATSEEPNIFGSVDPFGNASTDLSTELVDSQLHRLTDGGFEEDLGAYCFYARKNYMKGEQVLLGYGTYTDLELLEHYGFILDENPNDKVFIPLEHEIHSSSSWPKDGLYIHQNGKPSFALMSALRLWATPHSQRRSLGHLAYSGLRLSVENELRVLEWLMGNCHAMLKKLPTSSEEDCLLLSVILDFEGTKGWLSLEQRKVALPIEAEIRAFFDACGVKNGEFVSSERTEALLERWKLAVRWRLGYKKVLEACIDHCNETAFCLKQKP